VLGARPASKKALSSSFDNGERQSLRPARRLNGANASKRETDMNILMMKTAC